MTIGEGCRGLRNGKQVPVHRRCAVTREPAVVVFVDTVLGNALELVPPQPGSHRHQTDTGWLQKFRCRLQLPFAALDRYGSRAARDDPPQCRKCCPPADSDEHHQCPGPDRVLVLSVNNDRFPDGPVVLCRGQQQPGVVDAEVFQDIAQ